MPLRREVGGLIEQAQELLGGNHQDAEHQMGVHLGRAAHPHLASTVVVLQQTVDPLGLAARLIAFGFVGRKLALLPPPGIVVEMAHALLDGTPHG